MVVVMGAWVTVRTVIENTFKDRHGASCLVCKKEKRQRCFGLILLSLADSNRKQIHWCKWNYIDANLLFHGSLWEQLKNCPNPCTHRERWCENREVWLHSSCQRKPTEMVLMPCHQLWATVLKWGDKKNILEWYSCPSSIRDVPSPVLREENIFAE